MIINVTPEDIDQANAAKKEKNFLASKSCPVAKALQRITGLPYEWAYIAGEVEGDPEDAVREMITIPEDKEPVRRTVNTWDETGQMEPFSFQAEERVVSYR